MTPSILIVDDETSFRSVVLDLLQDNGWVAAGAASGEEALSLLNKGRYDIVFSDLRMPGIDGLTLLKEIKKKDPMIEVIMVTSHTSVSSAIEALRLGAYDYLIKPLEDIEQVLALVKRVSDKFSLEHEKAKLLEDLKVKNHELEESNLKVIQYSMDISALYAAEKEILAGLDLSEVYERSVASLSKLVGLRPAALWVLSGSGKNLLPEAQSGFETMDWPDWIVPVPQPLPKPTVEIQHALIEALKAKVSLESALFHPVYSHRKLLGFLGIFDSKKDPFTKRETDILSRLCSSVSLAIENARLYEKVKALAIRDGLTGLYNRRHFEEVLNTEVIRAVRHKHPASLIFLDVDYFKNYNDLQGHMMGDEALKEIANLLMKRARVTDIVCRYGGEEFVIILPYTDKANARMVAEEIRAHVEAHPFSNREQQPGGAVTVSLGISECPTDGESGSELLKRADEALYRAKGAGRNKVC